jgi:putative ABC transport system permease protein
MAGIRKSEGLLLRGMRWRLGLSLLTVLTAAIAVATAVLGPMYLHTAGDSVLRRTVDSAAVQSRGVTLTPYYSPTNALAVAQQAEHIVQRAPDAAHLFGAPIISASAGIALAVPGGTEAKSDLLSRTGMCAHLVFIHGRCDLSRGDVVMTARSAHQVGAHYGQVLTVQVGRSPLRLRVAGIAKTPDLGSSYWWGQGVEDFPFGQPASANGPAPTDSVIASQATVLSVGARAAPAVTVQMPVRSGSVDLGDEATVNRDLVRTNSQLQQQRIHLSSALASLLANANHQRHVMATIVAIAATQLVVLAVWVLGSLLVRSGDARRAEARVARLRGFPGSSMLWVTSAEPALLCVIGAVLGVAIAWAVILEARTQLFVTASSVAFDGWTIAALIVTLSAIVGALGLGTVRLLRSADLSEGATRRVRAASMFSLIADATLVVLAVVALVVLATSGALNGHTDPLASVAPGLIALGVAVLGVQLILFACRVGISLSDGSRWVAPFLALRQTARRPGVLRQARVLIIALALACFATAAWSVARTNRETAARFQVGARTVVNIAPTSPGTLESAVDRVDPNGRFAMAVADLHTSSTTLVGVEASRLGAVASWPSGISNRRLEAVQHAINPRIVPAVELPNRPVELSARVSASGQAASHLRDLDLSMWVFNTTGGSAIVNLGPLRDGAATYRGSLSAICPAGCRMSGLGVLPASGTRPPVSGAVQLTVTRIASPLAGGATRTAAAHLEASGWRSAAPGVDIAPGGGAGLTLTVSAAAMTTDAGATGASTAPMAAPDDAPHTLPAVVTSQLASVNVGSGTSFTSNGLDGNSINVRPAVLASALPRIGADAELLDLDLLSNVQTGPTDPGLTDEVWLGPRAPSDAVARLRAAGLDPTTVDRSATVFTQLQRSGPALADDFLLVATLAALLVAAASTLGSLGATTRERATELTSLEVAGVPRPTLIAALGLESAILLLTALCGVGAGVIAALMAIPSLPELTSSSLAPLHYNLPVGVIALVAVVVILLVAVAAGAVAVILVRRMTPILLRTAPDDVAG